MGRGQGECLARMKPQRERKKWKGWGRREGRIETGGRGTGEMTEEGDGGEQRQEQKGIKGEGGGERERAGQTDR